jgi:hypothetical protein
VFVWVAATCLVSAVIVMVAAASFRGPMVRIRRGAVQMAVSSLGRPLATGKTSIGESNRYSKMFEPPTRRAFDNAKFL